MHPDWLVPDWSAPGIDALMTTRRGGVSEGPFDSMNLRDGLGDDPQAVRRNQRLLADAIGAPPVYLDQVHGACVVRLGLADARPGAPLHAADGSVTTERGLACTVQVADCLPVLFAGPGVVGAAHAGWRGLAGGVLEATLHALCEAGRCTPGEVQAWLGPCIGPRRFEVGGDVVQAFGGDAAAGPARFQPQAGGKWLADLAGLARDRLAALGVPAVSGGGWCTVEEPSRFFSFRRDRVTGRMVAAIRLRA
jgi:YfiH family protein